MPTLFRLLVILGTIAGVIYGSIFALANFVQPRVAEMSQRVPPETVWYRPVSHAPHAVCVVLFWN